MDPKTVYDSSFFDNMTEGSLRSARVVVPLLLTFVRPRSVIDVGCGRGAWLAAFRENGVTEIMGLDGDYVDPARSLIPADRFRPTNLSHPFRLSDSFDLAVSLEVAEHLPPASAAGFIESLCRLAPVLLFSAAAPYQGGTHHVNEQWPEYWRQLFVRHNFHMYDPFRPRLWYTAEVDWTYRQNMFLCIRDDHFQDNSALHALPQVTAQSLMLMTPWVLDANLGLRASLLRLPHLAKRALGRRINRAQGK